MFSGCDIVHWNIDTLSHVAHVYCIIIIISQIITVQSKSWYLSIFFFFSVYHWLLFCERYHKSDCSVKLINYMTTNMESEVVT